jgi:phosphatidylserine/phosphatidylglycerophosphate/cardiolipin synthase-like enzyme
MQSRFLPLILALVAFTANATDNIAVFFSPKGGCTDAIVKELGKARSEVLVLAYSFTSAPIAKVLKDAHERGVKVSVILDSSNETTKYSSATFLTNAGIQTLIDSKHKIQHSKYMVVDRAVVITGSFNFSNAAEASNSENLLVIRDASLAEKYRQNWNEHSKHSTTYRERNLRTYYTN